IHPLALPKILAKQFSGRARRLLGGIEIVLHQTLRRTKRAKCTVENGVREAILSVRVILAGTVACITKKNREENKFSSRVEVRFVTPKKSGAVNSAIGLVPFLFRCFFLCCFLFSHRLIPPFQSATRATGEELGMTSLNWLQQSSHFFCQ